MCFAKSERRLRTALTLKILAVGAKPQLAPPQMCGALWNNLADITITAASIYYDSQETQI